MKKWKKLLSRKGVSVIAFVLAAGLLLFYGIG